MRFSFNIKNVDAIISENYLSRFKNNAVKRYCRGFDLSRIPHIERRKLNLGGRCIFSLVKSCDCPIVYTSYKGEINRSLDLLHSLGKTAAISPVSFSLSVLNSIPALLCIANGNNSDITAISSYPSLENGLLQGILALFDNKTANTCLVISYYEGENKPYFTIDDAYCAVTVEISEGNEVTVERYTEIDEMRVQNEFPLSEICFLSNYDLRKNFAFYDGKYIWKWSFND